MNYKSVFLYAIADMSKESISTFVFDVYGKQSRRLNRELGLRGINCRIENCRK